MRPGRGVLWAGLAAAAAWGGGPQANGESREALLRHCTRCHTEERIVSSLRTPQQWQQTVARMASRRQRLSGEGIPEEAREEILRGLRVVRE